MRNSNHFRPRHAYKSGSTLGVGPATVKFLLLALLGVFSVLFLIQSAQGSDMNIQMRQLNSQKETLQQESSTLTAEASRLQSIQKLNESATAQGMVLVTPPVETITLPAVQ